METAPAIADALADVGPRLKRLRVNRGITLTALAATTGISKSTLSRLETGQRRPSLELLLPIAEAHQVPIDELVGAPIVGDPRVRPVPRKRNGRIVVPLTQHPSGQHAWKVIIPPDTKEPELRIHEGHEWLCVLSGQLRLILEDIDITMGRGRSRSSTPDAPTGSEQQETSQSRSSACSGGMAKATTPVLPDTRPTGHNDPLALSLDDQFAPRRSGCLIAPRFVPPVRPHRWCGS